MFNVIKRLINVMFNSTFRTIGRVLGYLLVALLCMFIYNSFFKAQTIDVIDAPMKSDYLDYFGRFLENEKYLNKDYIAFSHFCNENEYCATLLLGDLQSGSVTDNYDIVVLDKLPTPGEETLNKLYQVNNTYYVTEKLDAVHTPIPLNEDLNGKTIYIKDLTDYFNNVATKHTSVYTNYAITTPSSSYIRDTDTLYNLCNYKSLDFGGSVGVGTYLAFLNTKGILKQRFEITYDGSCVVKSWHSTFGLNDYLSLTPFETTYNFKELDVTTLFNYVCTNCEYITLGENNYYETGIYDTINLKGNLVYSNKSDVSLERSTIYEKIIALSLLLIICFGICYKLIFNK